MSLHLVVDIEYHVVGSLDAGRIHVQVLGALFVLCDGDRGRASLPVIADLLVVLCEKGLEVQAGSDEKNQYQNHCRKRYPPKNFARGRPIHHYPEPDSDGEIECAQQGERPGHSQKGNQDESRGKGPENRPERVESVNHADIFPHEAPIP